MNKQLIERLAREAGAWDEPIEANSSPLIMGIEEMERFATLIAEECAKTCEDEGDFRGKAGAMWAAQAIRQLFKA